MKKAEAMTAMLDAMKLQHKSRWTIKAYSEWLAKYIDFLAICPLTSHEEKIGAFLSSIVNRFNVSISTQRQALCALVYFYKRVVKCELGDLRFCMARRVARLPEVFSRQEAWRVLDRLSGEAWLWGALMYGCGLRLEETCQLRVKDIDLDRRTLMVREGKGNKDRLFSPLPEQLIEPLRKHIAALADKHQHFAAAGVPVSLPDRLDKKYPAAPFSWEWFWLFPASGTCVDPQWQGKLYHIHKTAVQKRIRVAILAARIPKKAGCHTFRHSFATHWLENAEGSHEIAIKTLQELLGHKDVRTTMIYLHLLPKTSNVTSPLDARPASA